MTGLNWIKKHRNILNISEVEKESGLPFRTLRDVLNGKISLPVKYEQTLTEWVKKIKKD